MFALFVFAIATEAAKDQIVKDARLLIVDSSSSLVSAPKLSVDITALQNVVAHSLGVAPLQANAADSELFKTSFFKTARANMIISVDALGTASLDDCVFLNGLAQNSIEADEDHKVLSATLSGVSSPVYTSSSLAAMSTGLSPESKNLQTAYGIADILATTFEGQSLTVSMGGNAEQARAFCLHPTLQSENSECFDAYTKKQALPFSQTDLENVEDSKLSSLLTNRGIGTFSNGIFLKDGTAQLDMSAKVAAAFVTEMEAALWLMDAIEHGSLQILARDNVPDFYAVSFSSLKDLETTYGLGSLQVRFAKTVLDAVVQQMMSSLDAVYPQRSVVEVALLGSLPWSSKQGRRLLQNKAVGPNTLRTNGAEIDRFHIVLWLSIIVVLGLMMAVHALAFMPFKKDTMLYGTFNPDWESRKRN